jgi:hypothetical protein
VLSSFTSRPKRETIVKFCCLFVEFDWVVPAADEDEACAGGRTISEICSLLRSSNNDGDFVHSLFGTKNAAVVD